MSQMGWMKRIKTVTRSNDTAMYSKLEVEAALRGVLNDEELLRLAPAILRTLDNIKLSLTKQA